MNQDAVFSSALSFANYISQYYNEATGKQISPIKLQKSLYFCFAYWGAYIQKAKQNSLQSGVVETNLAQYPVYLFPENPVNHFEAWTYGPVIRSVHQEQNQIINAPTFENVEEITPEVFEMLDGLLKQLFDISDFSLVNISHCDDSWKENYDDAAVNHNKIMPHTDIISEYVKKYS